MEQDQNIRQVTCASDGCGRVFRFRVPAEPGIYEVKCPDGHPNRLRIHPRREPENDIRVHESDAQATETSDDRAQTPETITVAHTAMRVGGKLVMTPAGIFGKFKSKTFTLHPGPNTIGRRDQVHPSDIEIDNDRFVSRRSVVIDVTESRSGYLFKMTVMKSANPVILNGKNLVSGEVIYLNYGDTLQLGNTRLNFVKC